MAVFSHISAPHGVSTRLGGVSEGHLASLNLGFTVGDDPEKVWRNREIFARHLSQESLTWLLSMNHGSEVAVVNEKPVVPSERTVRPPTLYSADACITDRPGVPLSLTVADCVPVLFHDPVRRAVGVAHAGWRGTVARIVGKTVVAMRERYGSRPEDVRVGIGPSIGPEAFEVGEEVLREFARAFPANPEIRLPHRDPEAHRQGKGFVDLWSANEAAALEVGVLKENVEIGGWCTVSHPELFFSHRRDQGRSGRLIAAIILED